MLNFREPTLADKPMADRLLSPLAYRTSEYTFGNIFIWRCAYRFSLAFDGDFLFLKCEKNGRPYYLFPAGNGDLSSALEKIRQDARENGRAFAFVALTNGMKEALDALYPGKFRYTTDRGDWDYLYNAQELSTMAGRKLHGKRNHIRRFEELGEWRYEPLGDGNLEDCRQMNREWCLRNGCGQDPSLMAEKCAMEVSLRHYGELGFDAGLIRLNGKVVAFSMGEKLGSDSYCVHFEKAFGDIPGAYPVITREFSSRVCAGRAYINREEDMGREGLRKAKLSFYPAFLAEKYEGVWVE